METLTLFRKYEADCAHYLTDGVPEGHKCRRLHGHHYVIILGITGEVAPDGMLVEYEALDKIVRPILGPALLDHHSLNTLAERTTPSSPMTERYSANPTVELMVLWLRERLAFVNSARGDHKLRLTYIKVEEDPYSWVEWHASADRS